MGTFPLPRHQSDGAEVLRCDVRSYRLNDMMTVGGGESDDEAEEEDEDMGSDAGSAVSGNVEGEEDYGYESGNSNSSDNDSIDRDVSDYGDL